MPTFESPVEEIGSFHNNMIGDCLREELTSRWPKDPIDVVPVQREGHSMFDLTVRTDPLTAGEMRAFVRGFFTAFNNRHKLG